MDPINQIVKTLREQADFIENNRKEIIDPKLSLENNPGTMSLRESIVTVKHSITLEYETFSDAAKKKDSKKP